MDGLGREARLSWSRDAGGAGRLRQGVIARVLGRTRGGLRARSDSGPDRALRAVQWGPRLICGEALLRPSVAVGRRGCYSLTSSSAARATRTQAA